MYRLPAPDVTSLEAYDATVATIREDERRLPYIAARQTVHRGCSSFDRLGASLRFEQADPTDFSVGELEDHWMAELYDRQFATRKGTSSIRNGIKLAASYELCPYCGEGRVTELDHYLPKSRFAATTVHPANLIPACADCNREKLAYEPNALSPAVLHPYFDDLLSSPWLVALLMEGQLSNPVVTFTVSDMISDPDIIARLDAHLEVFGLRRRFGVWAAQALNNFENLVRSSPATPWSIELARSHLTWTATQQSGGRANSWEKATHDAMAASNWYLSEHLGLR